MPIILMGIFSHAYRSKVIDSILKNLSKTAVLNSIDETLNDAEFYFRFRAGLPNSHLIPSFSDKLRRKFYHAVVKNIPREYMQQAWKDV
jgi:hypothetical protein